MTATPATTPQLLRRSIAGAGIMLAVPAAALLFGSASAHADTTAAPPQPLGTVAGCSTLTCLLGQPGPSHAAPQTSPTAAASAAQVTPAAFATSGIDPIAQFVEACTFIPVVNIFIGNGANGLIPGSNGGNGGLLMGNGGRGADGLLPDTAGGNGGNGGLWWGNGGDGGTRPGCLPGGFTLLPAGMGNTAFLPRLASLCSIRPAGNGGTPAGRARRRCGHRRWVAPCVRPPWPRGSAPSWGAT